MIKPDKSKQDSKKIQIKKMFNDISSRYDQINKMMTLNMDKNWRKIVYHLSMQDNPSKIIDIATGTGDIALCFANDNVEVIGVDNASMMLDIANTKVSEITNVKFQLEDAENMSFEDNTFDVATVGFGVRNFEDLNQGLHEIKRVLKPGKKLGDIGHEIQTHVEKAGFSVVRDFCGHGIGDVFHQSPNVLHYGKKDTGPELQPGMTFTIEPMINAGKYEVKILNDGWTAVTKDKALSAQFEHTVGITDNGYEIFTESVKNLKRPPYN